MDISHLPFQPKKMDTDYVSTPAGLVLKKDLEEACRLFNVVPDSYENPTALGWKILEDSPQEREKYRELLGTETPKRTKSTTLKYLVESAVFSKYKGRYKASEAFAAYKANKDPEARRVVVRKIIEKQETNKAEPNKRISTKL